jgi:hypothetical protein
MTCKTSRLSLESLDGYRWKGEPKEMVYAGRLEEAALYETRLLIRWFGENGTPVHPNIMQVREHLSAKLGADQTCGC